MTEIPNKLSSVIFDRAVAGMCLGLSDLHIYGVIEFQTHLDAARLRRAIRASVDVEPRLGCRYVNHWWRPFWQRRDDLDDCAWLEVIDLTDAQNREQALQDCLAARFDPFDDLMVQAWLLREPTRDTLCVRTNHIVVDAGGTKAYLSLLARLYRELGEAGGLNVAPNLGGSRSAWQLWPVVGWRKIPRLFHQGLRNARRFLLPRIGDWNPSVVEQSGAVTRAYVLRHLSRSQVQTLKAYGAKHGATLNDIFFTALCRAMHKQLRPSPQIKLRLLGTVDLRRYLPGAQAGALCNLSSFLYLNIGREIGEHFGETLALVVAETAALKRNDVGLSDLVAIPPMLRSVPHRPMHKAMCALFSSVIPWMPPAMTNMGRIFSTQLVFGTEAVDYAYLVVPSIHPTSYLPGISGFDGRVTFSMAFFEPNVTRAEAASVLDGLLAELPMDMTKGESM